jgi:hypothetical protein
MPTVDQWDQIEHNQFIDGINKGQLIPVWVRSVEAGAYGRAGFTLSSPSQDSVEVIVRSIHDFGWSMNKSVYGDADKANVDSNGSPDALARLKWGERKGVQTGFPFRAELTVPWLCCGPQFQNAATVGHHEYEMVGAVVCKYPVFHEVATHAEGHVYQVFILDIPTSRNDFMLSLDSKMTSIGGDIADVWTAHKAEKYLPFADERYSAQADDDDLVHQRGLLYRDGGTGKWFATRLSGGNNGYGNSMLQGGFNAYESGTFHGCSSLNLCFVKPAEGSFSDYLASRPDLSPFVYHGDTDTNDAKLMSLLMPLCESFTSAEKYPTWFDADGKGIPSEFFLQTGVTTSKFDAAALYESHDYWESKGANNQIKASNPNLRINENGTFSWISGGDGGPEYGPETLETVSLYAYDDVIDKPGGSNAWHVASNVNSSLGEGKWSTTRVWREVTEELKTMLIDDAKSMY